MHNTQLISNEELQNAIENDSTNSKVKAAGELLLDAINDWPTHNLTDPGEFLIEIQTEVGSILSLKNIVEYSNTLNFNRDAWKLEAASSLIEIFNYDKNIPLDEIIYNISEFYKKDN